MNMHSHMLTTLEICVKRLMQRCASQAYISSKHQLLFSVDVLTPKPIKMKTNSEEKITFELKSS